MNFHMIFELLQKRMVHMEKIPVEKCEFVSKFRTAPIGTGTNNSQ